MSNSCDRGSEWRKWDLHIHSPLSILSNRYPKLPDGNPDWDAFVSKLESLTDIAVIGITDYFTIDGYKKLNELKRQGRLESIYTILPNIEFRLNSVISSKKDGQSPRRLNFHVIFSDEVSEQDIEEHFLHDLHFFYEGTPQDKDDTRKLKPSNLQALGRKLIEQHKKFKEMGLSPLQIGAMQAVVSHEDITECLKSSRFKGKYILVFPEELSNLIDWDGQDHHIRKGLLQKSDMVFSSNEKTRLWCLGQGPYTEGVENFIQEFKTCKPCIHGSDAHELTQIGHPCSLRGQMDHKCDPSGQGCELRYCWIKADPTFEGFKQLLYEPQDRIIIQGNNPTPIKSSYTLSSFKINQAKINPGLSMQNTDITLNSGLVAVTGSKGSGKTALVDLIANSYQDRCNTEDKNSFVKRIADDKPDFNTTITFQNNSQFTKSVRDGTFFQDSEIIYIAQGELEKYISDKSDLDVYVNNLIFESPKVKDTVINFDFIELGTTIKEIEDNIAKKNDLIVALEEQTKKRHLSALDLTIKQTQATLKDAEKRLQELQKAQSKEKIELAQSKQTAISEQKSRKGDLTTLRDFLTVAIAFIDDDIPSFNQNIDAINTLLKGLTINEHFAPLSYRQDITLRSRLATVKIELTKIVGDIETAQKELETFEAGVKEHAKLLEKKREITTAIADLTNQVAEFNRKVGKLTEERQALKGLFKRLLETIVLQKKKYEEIIAAFAAQKAEVLADLSFGAQINFDFKNFLQTAEDVMDNRKVDVNAMTYNVVSFIISIMNGDESGIPKFVDETDKLNRQNKDKLKPSQAITPGDFYRLLYGNYWTVIPTVKYKSVPLSKLSLGQKATVLIKIYLAQGDKPIIIDSHDDHLDNEFIMDELVKAIRQAKMYRQVILASNNGNVVINSDAEQVIIASRFDSLIRYISGSIENPIIRDCAVKVLEGGSEAFRRRQQKYRLN